MSEQSNGTDWIGVREAAELTADVSPRTLRRWCNNDAGPRHYRVGPHDRIRFKRSDVEKWMEDRAAEPSERGAA